MITAPLETPRPVELEYVAGRLAAARTAIGDAQDLLATRPLLAPADPERLDQVLTAATNAAEHLFDVAQVDEPLEAVREALAAAEAIMTAVHGFTVAEPTVEDRCAHITVQLHEVDATLAGLERRLHIPDEWRH